ncbi:hypothetical protein C5613_42065 [Rhodococcus opacus]|uniref:Uncharacterized protein n=1 Tax=Rhodococcus opacus TaxID=37919 RepID=A0A2S8IGC2_RHOOP|nr:hypothetical protein C5613_42065 [Rhodococcus opacus]
MGALQWALTLESTSCIERLCLADSEFRSASITSMVFTMWSRMVVALSVGNALSVGSALASGLVIPTVLMGSRTYPTCAGWSPRVAALRAAVTADALK